MNEPITAEALLHKFLAVLAVVPLLTGLVIGWLIRLGRKSPNSEHEESRRIAEEQAWIEKQRRERSGSQ